MQAALEGRNKYFLPRPKSLNLSSQARVRQMLLKKRAVYITNLIRLD
jgi:hypothetical protein